MRARVVSTDGFGAWARKHGTDPILSLSSRENDLCSLHHFIIFLYMQWGNYKFAMQRTIKDFLEYKTLCKLLRESHPAHLLHLKNYFQARGRKNMAIYTDLSQRNLFFAIMHIPKNTIRFLKIFKIFARNFILFISDFICFYCQNIFNILYKCD